MSCSHFKNYCQNVSHDNQESCEKVMESYFTWNRKDIHIICCPTCKKGYDVCFLRFLVDHKYHLSQFKGTSKEAIAKKMFPEESSDNKKEEEVSNLNIMQEMSSYLEVLAKNSSKMKEMMSEIVESLRIKDEELKKLNMKLDTFISSKTVEPTVEPTKKKRAPSKKVDVIPAKLKKVDAAKFSRVSSEDNHESIPKNIVDLTATNKEDRLENINKVWKEVFEDDF